MYLKSVQCVLLDVHFKSVCILTHKLRPAVPLRMEMSRSTVRPATSATSSTQENLPPASLIGGNASSSGVTLVCLRLHRELLKTPTLLISCSSNLMEIRYMHQVSPITYGHFTFQMGGGLGANISRTTKTT